MLLTLALVLAAWFVLSLPLTVVVGRVVAMGHREGPGPRPASESTQVIHLRW
jgi:hypothetical protein